eukprot:Filipodium_phascolosomae@DN8326_c0_g1_i1.p1
MHPLLPPICFCGATAAQLDGIETIISLHLTGDLCCSQSEVKDEHSAAAELNCRRNIGGCTHLDSGFGRCFGHRDDLLNDCFHALPRHSIGKWKCGRLKYC